MPIDPIEDVIEDLRLGRMVIIMDDEDRENEGDLLMAAEMARPDDINFMATHGRGLICLTLTRERCAQLNLPLMVPATDASHSTNFTVSIEAARGVTTGISAYDRAHTIRTAVAPHALPQDIVQPGHIFPLMAQPGGVLTRAGHTEAGCDLARLAGLEPASVIVEILKEDGSMARRPDLEVFAAQHGLKIGTISDLIGHRLRTETTIRRVSEKRLSAAQGDFRLTAYEDTLDARLHFALVRGNPAQDPAPLVRVHVQDTLCDLLGDYMDGCALPLQAAIARVAREPAGVVVVLGTPPDARGMLARLGAGAAGDEGWTKSLGAASQELRTHGIGAQILHDLGVSRMRVLSSPKIMHGLTGFGLEVTEYVTY
jgi:3,4-dihydroxy 2-butanone 4-phosphate synthase/GTP cyclohydrolase II